MPPAISVVIVSWNVREALRECLTAVRNEGTDAVAETWVVDNASILYYPTDSSRPTSRSVDRQRVRVRSGRKEYVC